MKIAKSIGMTRSPEAIEQRLRVLQYQHQQQHQLTLEKINELKEDNNQLRASLKQSQNSPDTSLKQDNQISVAITEIPSPDRSRFEILASHDGLRAMLVKQGEAIANLTNVVYRLQRQHEQQQPRSPPRQMGQSDEPQHARRPNRRQRRHTNVGIRRSSSINMSLRSYNSNSGRSNQQQQRLTSFLTLIRWRR